MKNKQLNRLLNTACEIITSLEHNADDDLMKTIDAMFNEIKYSDRIDDEMKVEEDDSPQDICDSIDDGICEVMNKYIKKDFVSKNGELFFEDGDIVTSFNYHLMGLQRLVIDTYGVPYTIVNTEHKYDGKTYLGNSINFDADLEAQDFGTFGEDKI
tara:strand:- start:260 stop:727 length:468 start_codon:yes stop_codon:yes gene_type:complete